MTQREQLIQLFRSHGYRVTLSQLLQTTLAAEYRARISELRHDGFFITCEKGQSPSANIYTMVEPDPDGQMRIA